MKLLLPPTKSLFLSTIITLLGLIPFPNKILAQTPASVYPRVAGYVGIVHPIVTFSSNGPHANFDGNYMVGMPIGINIWKTPKTGFSFEVAPSILTENGHSKMNNVLFHPGVLAFLKNGFSIAGRAAFETSGRYGFTPVLSKVIKKNKYSNYFLALPLPVRFGNDKPSSAGIGFQFALGF